MGNRTLSNPPDTKDVNIKAGAPLQLTGDHVVGALICLGSQVLTIQHIPVNQATSFLDRFEELYRRRHMDQPMHATMAKGCCKKTRTASHWYTLDTSSTSLRCPLKLWRESAKWDQRCAI